MKTFFSKPRLSTVKTLTISSVLLLSTSMATAKEHSYHKVAKAHPTAKLSKKLVENAKMQGECLVGLKELNYRKKRKVRSGSRMEQLSINFSA